MYVSKTSLDQYNSTGSGANKETLASIIEKCFLELESRTINSGLDLTNIYLQASNSEGVNRLKQLLNLREEPAGNIFQSFDCLVIAATVKKFLGELNYPLIPESFYDRFIQASRIEDDAIATDRLLELLEMLDDSSKQMVLYLIQHLARVHQLQSDFAYNEPLTKLCQIFYHYFLRPPWDRVTDIINNAHLSLRSLEIIVKLYIKNAENHSLESTSIYQIPTICSKTLPKPDLLPFMAQSISTPAVLTSRPQSLLKGPHQGLEKQDWFWDDIGREEANHLLLDEPDGSFLVRHSSNRSSGELTLTVKCNGSNKLVRIICKDFRCGFNEPLTFLTVVDLISFYMKNSLHTYNVLLNITLLYPIKKSHKGLNLESEDIETMKTKYLRYYKEIQQLSVKIEKLDEHRVKIAKELHQKRHISEHLQILSSCLDARLQDLSRRVSSTYAAPTRSSIDLEPWALGNTEQLRANESLLIEGRRIVEEEIAERVGVVRQCIKVASDLKSEMKKLVGMAENLKKQLSAKIDFDSIFKEMDHLTLVSPVASPITSKECMNNLALVECIKSPLASIKMPLSTPSPLGKSLPDNASNKIPHYNQLSWYKTCSRVEAEQLLSSQPDGTFLIRPSSDILSHALSIVSDSTVRHCIISRTKNGFGFTEESEFDSLMDLVLFYKYTSLAEHNPALNVMLKYPAFNRAYIFDDFDYCSQILSN